MRNVWRDSKGKLIGSELILDKWEDRKCEHYFERISINQAQCKNCGWGFFMNTDDDIVHGKLYSKGKAVEY